MKVQAYIHSLKDHEHGRHVLGEAEIIRQTGDNRFLAEVNRIWEVTPYTDEFSANCIDKAHLLG